MKKLSVSIIMLFALFAQLPIALAQSGDIGDAQATITAATAQAQSAQWQRQQAATRAALDLQAQAEATRSALSAQAAETSARIGATATAEAISAQATSAVHQSSLAATATAQSYSAQVAATIEAGAAQATIEAMSAAQAESDRRAEMGGNLLFAVGAVCIIALAVLLVRWAMMIKIIKPAPVEIVTAGYQVNEAYQLYGQGPNGNEPRAPVVGSGEAARMWEDGE